MDVNVDICPSCEAGAAYPCPDCGRPICEECAELAPILYGREGAAGQFLPHSEEDTLLCRACALRERIWYGWCYATLDGIRGEWYVHRRPDGAYRRQLARLLARILADPTGWHKTGQGE